MIVIWNKIHSFSHSNVQGSKSIINLTLMPLFSLLFCLLLSLVWPGIFNVSLLLIILVGCFYLDIMISIHAWAGYWPNWINKMGFLVILDFMQDLFYLDYVTAIFFPLFFTGLKVSSDLNITESFVVNWFFKCTCGNFFFALM